MVSVSARQLLLFLTDFLGGDPVPGAMKASAATHQSCGHAKGDSKFEMESIKEKGRENGAPCLAR